MHRDKERQPALRRQALQQDKMHQDLAWDHVMRQENRRKEVDLVAVVLDKNFAELVGILFFPEDRETVVELEGKEPVVELVVDIHQPVVGLDLGTGQTGWIVGIQDSQSVVKVGREPWGMQLAVEQGSLAAGAGKLLLPAELGLGMEMLPGVDKVMWPGLGT